MRGRKGAVVIAAAVLIAGCQGKPGDASARFACDEFREAATDYTDGILTKDELRAKIASASRDADLSEVRGLSEAGRAMLAELTAGRMGDEFDRAVRAFGDACRSIGY